MFEGFSNELSKRGIAYFMHSQRGIHVNDNPPLFFDMNVEEYLTYLPLNSVEDILHVIDELKKDKRLKNSKVYLLGISEGTIISTLFAEKYPDKVDALFLWGYVNINLRDTVIWQLSGGSFVPLFKEYFETDDAGRISKEAFESGQKEVLTGLGLGDDAFEVCDANHDGYIDEEEMVALGKSLIGFDSETILTAIEKRDDGWLLDDSNLAGQKFTSGWFLQHLALRSNMEILPELNLPIHIFHGTLDMNCDVQGVYDVYKRVQEFGKTNLNINVFKGYDHGLGVAGYLVTGEMPESLKAIFDAIDEMPLF
jgi:pimeloyl-ACP methyl ester carboxylesterase